MRIVTLITLIRVEAPLLPHLVTDIGNVRPSKARSESSHLPAQVGLVQLCLQLPEVNLQEEEWRQEWQVPLEEQKSKYTLNIEDLPLMSGAGT